MLNEKIALVTGATRGIGRAIALELGRLGATVVGTATSEDGAGKISAYLADAGIKGRGIVLNVTDAAQTDATLGELSKEFGAITILVNNAGITRDASLMKMEEAQFDQVIDVNLKGVFNCAKAAGAVMAQQKSGAIVNTSSVVAVYGNFGQTNYVASKSGIIGMTKVWARELGRKGVRVNAVAPGFIATEMVLTVPENILNNLKEKTPLGRLGEPEEIANVYLFLVSEESSYINGALIQVDGGLVL